jgi:CO dehydrogenase nickel-insertion accessory protein CooC1
MNKKELAGLKYVNQVLKENDGLKKLLRAKRKQIFHLGEEIFNLRQSIESMKNETLRIQNKFSNTNLKVVISGLMDTHAKGCICTECVMGKSLMAALK